MRIPTRLALLLALCATLLHPAPAQADLCPVGQYSATGSDPCTPCPLGRYADMVGSTVCTPCPFGTYTSSQGSVACTDCSPGKYASSLGSSTCLDCSPGKYASSTGSSACTNCSPGTYASALGSITCTDCSPGTHQPASAAVSCLNCGIGTSQPLSGQAACAPCAAGTYTSTTASATCIDCAAGTYQPSSASSTCLNCASGTYAAATGSTACTGCTPACPAGQYETAVCTATSDTGCDLCDASCTTCSGPSASECTSCPTANPPSSGVCLPGCTATPATGCRLPAVAGKSTLLIKDNANDAKDQLKWSWNKGSATTFAELGDPVTTDGYFLCVYDGIELVSAMTLPPGGLCDGKPCWAAKPKNPNSFVYKDKELTPDGAFTAKLKSGAAEKAMIGVLGKGAPLDTPDPLGFVGPIRVQLQRADAGICFESVFSAPFKKNVPGTFSDTAD